MHEPAHFVVDLFDKDDIKAKIPLAEQVLAEKEEAARRAAAEVEAWKGTVAHLRNLAAHGSHLPTAEHRRNRQAEGKGRMQAAVVGVVEDVDMPMRPQEVADRLASAGIAYASVAAINSALYSAWQNGFLSKAGKGLYAPRDYTDGVLYREED